MAVEGTAGLGISREHVFVHALLDTVEGHPTVSFSVDGLFSSPTRTAEMRRSLCEAIATTIAIFLNQADLAYESVIGWCSSIDREESGFVKLPIEQSPD